MNDQIKAAQDKAVKDFVSSVGRALAGMSGDVDMVCDFFTEDHDRHTAQAVLQLIHRIENIRQQTAQDVRRRLRQQSGFDG